MHNSFSRRAILSFGAGALAVTALPRAALALTEDKAKFLVTKLVDDINGIIASGKSESAMFKDFERIFSTYADVPVIARYALGVEARRASAGQMAAFTAAFQRYISVKYGKRFREFIGGQIEVREARKIKDNYEVKTIAKLRGQSPFVVTFHVSDRSGKDLFFNMFIEGINMLLTERTEIGAMLDRRKGNLDALISDLKTAG